MDIATFLNTLRLVETLCGAMKISRPVKHSEYGTNLNAHPIVYDDTIPGFPVIKPDCKAFVKNPDSETPTVTLLLNPEQNDSPRIDITENGWRIHATGKWPLWLNHMSTYLMPATEA